MLSPISVSIIFTIWQLNCVLWTTSRTKYSSALYYSMDDACCDISLGIDSWSLQSYSQNKSWANSLTGESFFGYTIGKCYDIGIPIFIISFWFFSTFIFSQGYFQPCTWLLCFHKNITIEWSVYLPTAYLKYLLHINSISSQL